MLLLILANLTLEAQNIIGQNNNNIVNNPPFIKESMEDLSFSQKFDFLRLDTEQTDNGVFFRLYMGEDFGRTQKVGIPELPTYNKLIEIPYGAEVQIEYKNIITESISLDKYGKYYRNTDDYKESYKKTCLDKYGVEHFSKTSEYKEKFKTTSLEKYGVEHYNKTDEYNKKCKSTSMEKYGVEHHTKSETYHWHNVCDVVHLFVGMHEVCRKLRQTGVADNGHDKKCRTALGLVAQSLQGQGELCGIDNRHEERHGKHGINAYMSAKSANNATQDYQQD